MDDNETIIDQFTTIGPHAHEFTVWQFPSGDVFIQSELTGHPGVPSDVILIPASAVARVRRILAMAEPAPIFDGRQNVFSLHRRA